MALTKVKQVVADIEQTVETWKFADAIGSGIAVLQPVSKRAGVTLSGTPGATQSVTIGDTGITISGLPVPDNGQDALHSSVMTTGTFYGPVVGASSSTPDGTPVYIKSDGTLTLTSSDAEAWGIVQRPHGFRVEGTVVPIKIGV